MAILGVLFLLQSMSVIIIAFMICCKRTAQTPTVLSNICKRLILTSCLPCFSVVSCEEIGGWLISVFWF